jgi:hypothetical protein
LLIDLSWNSSRLEGNTYSLLETERLLNLGEAANERDAREAQMILNHKDAIEFLVDASEDRGFVGGGQDPLPIGFLRGVQPAALALNSGVACARYFGAALRES